MASVESPRFDPERLVRQLIPDQGTPPRHPYSDFIESIHRAHDGSDFGDQFARHYDLDNKELKERVEGKIVLDLGGGVCSDGQSVMQDIAEQLGAATYINVDRFHDLGPLPEVPTFRDVTDDLRVVTRPVDMPVIYLQADMLDILGRMADNSEGIIISLNGIDDNIIRTRHRYFTGSRYLNYHELLAKEIARVLPPNGTVLTCTSDASESFERYGLCLAPGFRKSPLLPEMWVKPK